MLNAMIFAAGLGSRLKPFTNDKPKALVALAGKPLLQRAIEKLKKLGVDRIVINVHHFADLIEDFLKENDNFGVDIRVSDERGELLETGGGLKKARSYLFPMHRY
jgi:NDP-sugar pyrophosphorylase family protein